MTLNKKQKIWAFALVTLFILGVLIEHYYFNLPYPIQMS